MTENRTLAEFGGGADGDADERAAPTDSPGAGDSDGGVEDAAADPTEGDEAPAEVDAPVEGDEAPTLTSEGPAVDAPTVTYAWSPEDVTCGACGETVDRRWRAGEGAAVPNSLVCDSCKEW